MSDVLEKISYFWTVIPDTLGGVQGNPPWENQIQI